MHVLVLMSGGFHPFHPGHLALYQTAKKAFPNGDVVIGATNVQTDRPFSFKDKAALAQIAGVDPNNFVEVNRQFMVKGEPNLESRIEDPENTILVFVRSKKDMNEQPQPWRRNSDGSVPISKKTGKPLSDYLLSYDENKNNLEPMTKHAYIAYLPVVPFTGDMKSATEIRNMWPKLDNKGKQQMAMQLYPATQHNANQLKKVISILDRNLGNNLIKEYISKMRPLMKEATIEQKIKILKLLKEAYSKEFTSNNTINEGLVLGPQDLVDVYIVGKDKKGNKIRHLVKSAISNNKIPSLLDFLDSRGINRNAIVYGPSNASAIQEKADYCDACERPKSQCGCREDYLEEK